MGTLKFCVGNVIQNVKNEMDSLKLCVGNLVQNVNNQLFSTAPTPNKNVNSALVANKPLKDHNNSSLSKPKQDVKVQNVNNQLLAIEPTPHTNVKSALVANKTLKDPKEGSVSQPKQDVKVQNVNNQLLATEPTPNTNVNSALVANKTLKDPKEGSVSQPKQDVKVQNVGNQLFATTPTPHSNVISALVANKSLKDPNNRSLSQPKQDVKTNMVIKKQDSNLSSRKLIFACPASKHFIPSSEGFVRQPLPERDYELSPLDPNKPSIHVLVDDVMIKILGYLPLKKLVLCEVVCRRWQALLYVMFGSTTEMNISKKFVIKHSLNVSKAMLSKILLLTGETLNSFTISETGFSNTVVNKLFLMLSQFCPNLKFLELADEANVYFDHIKALKDCKNLKWFSAKKNSDFKESSLKTLITVLPWIENIDVSHTAIKGNCFNLLPKGLRHLNINHCTQVSKKNLHKLSKTCKNLEELEIENLDIDDFFLEELAVNCSNLSSLRLFIRSEVDFSNQIKLFTKLTYLRIYTLTFELPNIADIVKDLEELHIAIYDKTKKHVDFGKFAQLKTVILYNSPFSKQELMSLEKCRNLQSIIIQSCDNIDQNIIIKILKGCPEINHVRCPQVDIDQKFLNDIHDIMKNRSEPIKMSVNAGAYSRWFKTQYDTIKFASVNENSDDDSKDDTDDDESDDDDSDDNDSDDDDFNYDEFNNSDHMDMHYMDEHFDSDNPPDDDDIIHMLRMAM
ncbi:unnamed protein product [Meganyctiphanes norvegica]|uniref:F-box domain-containing protein n=1 Tax=Meganyctiphanes norvegica TaxID=48144 RepID=A0AAV2QAE7_MEGNR